MASRVFGREFQFVILQGKNWLSVDVVKIQYATVSMDGVWVSIDHYLHGYDDDRTFVMMEVHQPSTSPEVLGCFCS